MKNEVGFDQGGNGNKKGDNYVITLLDVKGVPCLTFQKANEPYYTLDEMEAYVLSGGHSICVARDTACYCLEPLLRVMKRCLESDAHPQYSGKRLTEWYAEYSFRDVSDGFYDYDLMECEDRVTWLLEAPTPDELLLEGWRMDFGEEPPDMECLFQFRLNRDTFLDWAKAAIEFGKQFCTPDELKWLFA